MRRRFFGIQYAVSELLLAGLFVIALFNMVEDSALVGWVVMAAILFILTKAIHMVRARSYTGEYVPVLSDHSALHYAR